MSSATSHPPRTRAKIGTRRHQRRISSILRAYGHIDDHEPTLGELAHAFDTRAFGAFFILFGGLNLVPMPPGVSILFGVPLVLFTWQLAVGRDRLWLPQRLSEKTIKPASIAALMRRAGFALRRVERLARKRYWPQAERVTLMATGWYCLLLALVVSIPFPFTNLAPGIAIALAGLAITARDGLWLAASVFVGLASLAILGGVYGAVIVALSHLF